MSITIADVKQRLAGKLHGTSISKLQDFYGLAFEAAGNLLGKIDVKETVRIEPITNAIYDKIYDYVVPVDIKEDAILSVKPQGYNRLVSDKFTNRSEEEFDRFKTSGDFTIQNNSGVKTLRLSKALNANIAFRKCDQLIEGGTWTASSNATNLEVDTFNKVAGTGSLKFDISAGGTTAILTIDDSTESNLIDWTSLVNTGSVFMWVYIPNTTAITSVNLEWGSMFYGAVVGSYNRTVTTTQNNTAFTTGWNLLRFDWSGSTFVGIGFFPESIGYAKVTFNYNGTAVPSCRIDSILGSLGTIYECEYFSKYLFKTAGGTWIEKPTLDSDILNLDTTSFNLFLYELAELAGQEIGGQDSSFDISYISNKKKETWDAYTQANKSERKKKQTAYYPLANRRRR